MLPATRCEGDLYAVPKFALDRAEVEGFMDELQGFHAEFRDCFMRSEPRENFLLYMAGQFGALERKSIEPIALQVEDGNVRAMQRFVSDVVWIFDHAATADVPQSTAVITVCRAHTHAASATDDES